VFSRSGLKTYGIAGHNTGYVSELSGLRKGTPVTVIPSVKACLKCVSIMDLVTEFISKIPEKKLLSYCVAVTNPPNNKILLERSK
jgi:hypothetical protein